MRNAYKTLVGKPEGKTLLGRPTFNVKIILHWILGKYGGRAWTEFIWCRIRASGGLL
jgi:hypothetical protein